MQYVNYLFEFGSALGTQLAPGAQTAGAGAVPTASEATTFQKTLGLFVEQAAAINDRLFLTAALRTDQNSAFGTNFQSVYYPKGSVSWIMSDESFFPKWDFLNQFRFRAAIGSSGVQPGPNDALRFYARPPRTIAASTRRPWSTVPSATRTSSQSGRPSSRRALTPSS
ncbi:MAG: TonB-dependent receptor [Gemmatimonadetes bacterium]|nr:TonB-dependent receptor [Gemmatimonadota bacterium]